MVIVQVFFYLKLIIFYLILTTLFFTSFTEAWRPKETPKIGISRWITVDEDDRGRGEWQRDFENMTEGALSILDNDNTYVVSQHLTALSFDCNASYPVQWVFHHAEYAGHQLYSIRIRTSRRSKDIWNPRENKFSSVLEIYGDTNLVTGNYSCMSTEEEKVRKSIYIYWQGSSPPYLLLSGETITVRSKDSKTVELPCRISQPDIEVSLFKESSSLKYEPVSSPFVKFDAKIGFIIDLHQYNDPFGRYKCTTKESDDPVVIKVEKGQQEQIKFNNTLVGNATIFFNQADQEIVCCSNSSKPPNLHDVFCFDPVSCKMKEFILYKMGNNGRRSKNKSCTYDKIYPRDSGMLRCRGDGIDVFRNFYTDMAQYPIYLNKGNRSINVYFNWADIKPEKMLILTPSIRKPIYERQNITVSCDTSYFYFSEGLKWAVRWNNGSLIFAEEPKDTGFDDIRSISGYQSLRLSVNKNMTEVLCFAPVWNTTEWVNQTFQLDVQESYSPKFDGPEIEIVKLTLNETEKTLKCRAEGTPTPALRWRKNNRTITHESNMVVKRRNGTSVLTIHRVSHDSHGDYKCTAINLAGKTEKIIRVYVEEINSSMGAASIIFLVLVLVAFIAGVSFLVWKMKLQKKIIDHLTGVVFRDVTPEARNQTNP